MREYFRILVLDMVDVVKTLIHMAAILFVAGFTILGLLFILYTLVDIVHPFDSPACKCKCKG